MFYGGDKPPVDSLDNERANCPRKNVRVGIKAYLFITII